MARFGARVHAELQRLCHMGTERPIVGQWQAWQARFDSLVLVESDTQRANVLHILPRCLSNVTRFALAFLTDARIDRESVSAPVRCRRWSPRQGCGGP